jgi:hypothetical protein
MGMNLSRLRGACRITTIFWPLLALFLLAAAVLPSSASAAAPAASRSDTLQSTINTFLAAHPQGTQISPNAVSFDHGNVVEVFTNRHGHTTDPEASPDTTYVHGCPEGTIVHWYCFYEFKNYNKDAPIKHPRRLQFKDCGGTQYFSNYGFRNEASSWVNPTYHTIRAYDYYAGGDGGGRLWTEGPHSRSSYVGNSKNNRADYFTTTC